MDGPTDFTTPTNISWQGHTGVVEYGGGDKSMVVIFYNRPCHNPAKSAEAGRPVYEDKVYARIAPPGERMNIVDRPVQQSDLKRWPMQWHQFQQNKQQTPEGTPIEMLFPDHPSIGATLRACNVHTVEQCSEMSGTAIDTVGIGAQHYCNAAKDYLKKANKGVGIAQHRRELEERDREITTLKNNVARMQAEMERMRNEAVGMTPEQVQMMIAASQGRPAYPNPAHNPALNRMPPAGFDTATAQINALHPTAEVTQQQQKPRRRERIRAS